MQTRRIHKEAICGPMPKQTYLTEPQSVCVGSFMPAVSRSTASNGLGGSQMGCLTRGLKAGNLFVTLEKRFSAADRAILRGCYFFHRFHSVSLIYSLTFWIGPCVSQMAPSSSCSFVPSSSSSSSIRCFDRMFPTTENSTPSVLVTFVHICSHLYVFFNVSDI